MARVLAIVPDLMLSSRVVESLSAAGHEVEVDSSLQESPLEGVDLIVADLDIENPEALVGLGVPVLGFYSHVDVDTKQAAEAAGLDMVVPRSRMSRDLPLLVDTLVKDGAG
jgi:hypothetical protein